MNAVDRTKAGVASGILSMNRMVGGTFGVADRSARWWRRSGARRSTSCCPQLPGRRALDAGRRPRLRRRQHGIPARVVDASQQAFVYALHYGLRARLRGRAARRARRVRADQAQPGRRSRQQPPRRRAPSRRRRGRPEQPPGAGARARARDVGPEAPRLRRRRLARRAGSPAPTVPEPRSKPAWHSTFAVSRRQDRARRAAEDDGRMGDPPGAPGRAERRVPARGDRDARAGRVRGDRARDGGGRELQQRLGGAGQAGLGVRYGDHPEYGHHIGGSDASGIVWKVVAGLPARHARRRPSTRRRRRPAADVVSELGVVAVRHTPRPARPAPPTRCCS